MILHIDKGIDYFYEYLEQCVIIYENLHYEDDSSENRDALDLCENNLRLLGLFMDIRCYD